MKEDAMQYSTTRHSAIVGAFAIGASMLILTPPADASPIAVTMPIAERSHSNVLTVRRGGARGGFARSRSFSSGRVVTRRGGGAYARSSNVHVRNRNVRNRTVTRRAKVVRPGWQGGGMRWVRPAHYWWRPGAAIAAGAAIGFVSAATAYAWAGDPPGANMCWYYTDRSRTEGFWDVCPT